MDGLKWKRAHTSFMARKRGGVKRYYIYQASKPHGTYYILVDPDCLKRHVLWFQSRRVGFEPFEKIRLMVGRPRDLMRAAEIDAVLRHTVEHDTD